MTVAATASDSDGTIQKVEFFNGTTLLGSSAVSPYNFQWSNVQAGSYGLTAKATDNSGATAISATAYITVNATSCSASTTSILLPFVSTQAQWDTKYSAAGYGPSQLPEVDVFSEAVPGTFAWHGHYWLRSYVSMGKTFGDTKYLDWSVRTIDYWFTRANPAVGWVSPDQAQTQLQTGMIASAILTFAYEAWSDQRFAAYRPKADLYVTKLETMIHSYDWQWIDNAPFPGSPGFYRYTCGTALCGETSLLMYNQGAIMAKALFLIDRIKRIKGESPDPGYLDKANKASAYFKTFAKLTAGNAYSWNYAGARTDTSAISIGIEDTGHAHVDLSLLVAAGKFGLGGVDSADMSRLAATMHKVLNGAAGPNDVSLKVDGTGNRPTNWEHRVDVGYDWIDLVDYDPALLDKVINVYNRYLTAVNGSRFFLGWAEIQRKRNCVNLVGN
ncbi:MAG: Ig-like domain-containing protein [Burkholderiales bacterium]